MGYCMNYYMIHTTYPILFLSVFARQLSLPVPAVLFLLAGGALAGAGKLSFAGILVVAVLGCLMGDLIWFEAGRRSGRRVLRLFCALAPDPSASIRRSKSNFARRGLPTLLFAKFIPGLDGIMPPLAGMSGAARAQFTLYDAGGSVLWSAAYIGAGFLFAAQLDKVTRLTSLVSNTLVLVLGVPLLILFVLKLLRLLHMIRQIRPLHITPQYLKERLDAGDKIGLMDLLRFEDDPQDSRVIPGSIRADPLKLRSKVRITLPEHVYLVLYCESGNSFVSARVAAALRKRGIQRIFILDGGMAAWVACGYPLSPPRDPFAELQRLGIQASPSPWEAPGAESQPVSN